MIIVLACEGPSEIALISNLMERGYLNFNAPLLLDKPLELRQLSKFAYAINSLPIDEEIVIYRIGDTLHDELSLSNFKLREPYIKIHKVCTKPEIEILVIINEGLYSEYAKRHVKPKVFLKEKKITFNPHEYFGKNDMLPAIKEYKRIKKHNKAELFLVDFLDF